MVRNKKRLLELALQNALKKSNFGVNERRKRVRDLKNEMRIQSMLFNKISNDKKAILAKNIFDARIRLQKLNKAYHTVNNNQKKKDVEKLVRIEHEIKRVKKVLYKNVSELLAFLRNEVKNLSNNIKIATKNLKKEEDKNTDDSEIECKILRADINMDKQKISVDVYADVIVLKKR